MNRLPRSFQSTLTPPGLRQFGLELETAVPAAPMKSVVQCYLQVTAAVPTLYPVLPDGTQAIYFSSEGCLLGGAQSRCRDIPLLQPGQYFGIWFYAGALRHFFKLDLSDISNQLVGMEYLPCRDAAALQPQVYEQDSFLARAQVCERWLLRHYKPCAVSPLDQALSVIYRCAGDLNISELTKTGWSVRHLNRRFLQHTGLNVKAFAQLMRLQHACSRLLDRRENHLDIALDLGFYDQAHMVNVFRKHLLLSPGQYLKRFMSDFSNR